ncbi:hypothetical protein [Sulfurimonas sp.]
MLTNTKLLEIVEEIIDINDFDIETIPKFNKDFIYDEVYGYIYTNIDSLTLEKLLGYIDEKDYDLDNLLFYTQFNSDNLDINLLSQNQIAQINDELKLSISELEYEIKLITIEEELATKESHSNQLTLLENEYNKEQEYIYVNQEIAHLRAEKNKIIEELKSLQVNHQEIDKEARIKEIQAKNYVSPKELSILYPDMSISSQATYRGRLKDKLPYHQKTKRGKITYIVSEIQGWRENQNWKHL